MRTILGGALIGAALLLTVPAIAQDSGGDALPERTINFGDDTITGDLVRPDGEFIEGLSGGPTRSLITIREHFIDKMIESVDDI